MGISLAHMADDLTTAAEQWIAADPDPQTRAELRRLVASHDHSELAERMAGALEFGTAGLRGRVEAGSNRMNRAVVIRTTAGLAAHYTGRGGDGPIVVGHDARLSSRRFMDDTIDVLGAAGIPVRYFPEPVPTPLVAFAALELGARAAIVITASHNPPADNGYKVYDTNGAQIVPPTDRLIAGAIERVGPATGVRLLAGEWHAPLVEAVPIDIFERYLERLSEIRTAAEPPHQIRIVFTPMHGVGGEYVVSALNRFGHHSVDPVAEQFAPDGHFPTVAFPNPEEPGALDLAIAQAQESNADLILANDPDTDRLAAAAPDAAGNWVPLTGNQIGVLLGEYLLTHTKIDAPIVLNSIVSSPMLAAIAAHHGAAHAATLTGFKWIWNAALDLEAGSVGRFLFGYEEALGYCVTPAVRDKDGISAAVIFADLVAGAAADNRTVWDLLADLYRRHGLWVSVQHSVVRAGVDGATEITAAIDTIAANPPDEIDGVPVVAVTDYRTGDDERPRYLGATPLVVFDLGDRGRVLVRPSGTEPKMKIYVDLTAPVTGDADLGALDSQLTDKARSIATALAGAMGLG